MSLSRFIPEVWSARLLQALQDRLVFAQDGALTNRNYEGEIRSGGDKLHIHSIGDVSIGDYARDTTIGPPERLTDSRITLQIDQAKYFNFAVDDIDQVQQKPKAIDTISANATYGLASVADGFVSGFYTQAGTVQDDGAGASVALTSQNVYSEFVKAAIALDEKNVPDDRVAVVPPWVVGLLLENDRFLSANVGAILNGEVGSVAGFRVLKSNRVPVTGTSSQVTHVMCGTSDAITFADQIVETEAYRPHDTFADAVKGLHVYGARILRPECLLDFQVSKG